MKEEAGSKKKRRGEADYVEEDIDKYLGLKDKKSSKKFRRWDLITAVLFSSKHPVYGNFGILFNII